MKDISKIVKKENITWIVVLILIVLFGRTIYKFLKNILYSITSLFGSGGNAEAAEDFTTKFDEFLELHPQLSRGTLVARANELEDKMNATGTDEEGVLTIMNSLESAEELDGLYLAFGMRRNWTMLIPSEPMDLFGWFNSEFGNGLFGLFSDKPVVDTLKNLYVFYDDTKYKYK